jgi:hypothetical protein
MVGEKTGSGVPSGVGVQAGRGYCIRMGATLPMGGSDWAGSWLQEETEMTARNSRNNETGTRREWKNGEGKCGT